MRLLLEPIALSGFFTHGVINGNAHLLNEELRRREEIEEILRFRQDIERRRQLIRDNNNGIDDGDGGMIVVGIGEAIHLQVCKFIYVLAFFF